MQGIKEEAPSPITKEAQTATQVYNNDSNTSSTPDNTKSTTTILIILIFFLLMMMSARYIFRRRLNKLEQKSPETLNRQKQIRDDIDQILANIQDISRENIAKLDNKIRVLNQLIVEADMKIKELHLLSKNTSNISTIGKGQKPQPLNPLHEKVFKCVDRGMDVTAICAETGLEKGEVELIISLRHINSTNY